MDPKTTLRKGETGPLPKDTPAALAWLFRMFAAMKALFTSAEQLPELAEFLPQDNAKPENQPFVVVAWTSAKAYHTAELRAFWPIRNELDGIADTIRLHVSHLRDIKNACKDRPQVLGSTEDKRPEEVDFLIADMATAHPSACLTLMGPGVCIRLNRQARRAALARVRRSFRRELRKEASGRKEGRREPRRLHDRARRSKLSKLATRGRLAC